MKRLLFILILFIKSIFACSQITWVGATGGNWNTTSNWSPAIVPTSADNVIFNTSVTVNMDVLSSSFYTINSLLITSNSSVVFRRTEAGGGVRVLRVASTSLTPKGLQIDNGSTLTIDANNTAGGDLNFQLALTGGNMVTGEISGNLFFTGSGIGIGSAELNLFQDPTNNGVLTVKNSGVIKYFPNTGNTTPSTSSLLTMENGSSYEMNKNGGSIPPGNWQPLSVVRITGMTSNGPLFNGSSYGNLEWNAPSQTSTSTIGKDISFNHVELINTGSSAIRLKGGTLSSTFTMVLTGDFIVHSAAIFEISGASPPGGGGVLKIQGQLYNDGLIRENTTSLINTIELNGIANQNISGSGTYSGSEILFIMNNIAGATLLSPLVLPGNLTLTAGKIKSTATNLLTMVDNTTVSGSSTTSFVDGPMKKIGDDDFLFPIGKGGIVAPLGISGGAGAVTDEFTAEYIRTNPQTLHGACPTFCDPSLDHISYVEYWTLVQNNGTSSKQVTLGVHALSFCKVLASTYVSRWNGSIWTNETTFTTFGPLPCGSGLQCGLRTTVGTLSSFGEFTLATDLPFITNPLPIKLISFSAIKSGLSSALLNWELAEICSKDARFEIHLSADGRNFTFLRELLGSEISRYYNSIVTRSQQGITYYRLKMIDYDGSVTYSSIVAVINDNKGLMITSILPNPVQRSAAIELSVAKKGIVNFEVYNIAGQPVKRWTAAVAEGSNTISTNFDGIPAGVYHVLAQNADSRTVFRFVKQ